MSTQSLAELRQAGLDQILAMNRAKDNIKSVNDSEVKPSRAKVKAAALELGKVLLEIKAQFRAGTSGANLTWDKWIDSNFGLSTRTADRYIEDVEFPGARVARRRQARQTPTAHVSEPSPPPPDTRDTIIARWVPRHPVLGAEVPGSRPPTCAPGSERSKRSCRAAWTPPRS